CASDSSGYWYFDVW
nr:immunoglobulin heavy chain junction region [Mus musculus]MBK4198738.1 immunoglobulin heavy chain junction region [Mus musculus]